MADPASTPLELFRLLGGGTALVAAAGWLLKRVRRWWTTRRAEAKALRNLLDAQRHVLLSIVPEEHGGGLMNLDELIRQKALIDDAREAVWIADGNESNRQTEATVAEVVKVLSRTQAIRRLKQPKDSEGDMFKDGWRGDR